MFLGYGGSWGAGHHHQGGHGGYGKFFILCFQSNMRFPQYETPQQCLKLIEEEEYLIWATTILF